MADPFALPDFDDVVRSSFARQGLMTHLGARITRVEPGVVDLEVNYAASLTQQHGYFHGGVSTALADSACGYAALTLARPDSEVLTVSLSVNLLAPARGDLLIARGRVVRAGRTVTVCRGEVYALSAATDQSHHHEEPREVHVASVTATLMQVTAAAGGR